MRDRALVRRRLQPPRVVRHPTWWAERDHHRRPAVDLTRVCPQRGISAFSQRMPEITAQQLRVKAGAEHLLMRRVQPGQMEIKAPDPAITDLHRGEVAVAGQRGCPQLGIGRTAAVDLDVLRFFAEHRHVPSASLDVTGEATLSLRHV